MVSSEREKLLTYIDEHQFDSIDDCIDCLSPEQVAIMLHAADLDVPIDIEDLEYAQKTFGPVTGAGLYIDYLEYMIEEINAADI